MADVKDGQLQNIIGLLILSISAMPVKFAVTTVNIALEWDGTIAEESDGWRLLDSAIGQ